MSDESICKLCGGYGQVSFEDPTTRAPASILCPSCAPLDVDLNPQVEEARS